MKKHHKLKITSSHSLIQAHCSACGEVWSIGINYLNGNVSRTKLMGTFYPYLWNIEECKKESRLRTLIK